MYLATNVFASDLINNTTAQTIQGGNLRITLPPAVKIDGSARLLQILLLQTLLQQMVLFM